MKASLTGGVEHSSESSLGPWRKKATDVYSLFMTSASLPVVFAVIFIKVVDPFQSFMAITAWIFTLSAAVLRPIKIRNRIFLMVAAGWIYAALTLSRGGIFLNFRLPLINLAMMALILGGVRFGLAIGGANILFMIAAVWGTHAGLLPQAPPPWSGAEVRVQYLMVLMNFVPQFLLLAWFSYHLTTSIRREKETAVRLREEATLRQRLEGEVVEAGEKISRRIGSELHDGVCQDLTGLMLRSKRAQKKLQAEHSPEAETLEGIVHGLGEAIGEIHGLSRSLSPGALAGQDLAGAIEDLVRRFAEATDAAIEFRTTDNGPVLNSGAALHLYRIAQEAIANAVRHSGADRIEVLFEQNPTETLLRVKDDGHWTEKTSQDGLGQNTIRWRASIIGGALLLGPMPKGGTCVECRVPIRKENVESDDES